MVHTYQRQKPLKYAGNQSLVAVTALKSTEKKGALSIYNISGKLH